MNILRFRFLMDCVTKGMSPLALLFGSLQAVLSLVLCATNLSFAQTTSTFSQPPVGVVSDPCAGIPKPPDASAFLAAIDEAQKKHMPMPQPPAELTAAFKRYNSQLLELDFGNLCRYAADNAKLPQASDHRLVMMGDSITEGWTRLDQKLFTGDVIGPAELEALLLEHPAVADCAVVGVPDREAGEVPKAFVKVKDGAPLDVDDLAAWVSLRIAA